MDDTKHTPGPWVIDERYDGCVYSSDDTGSIVARCGGRGFEFVAREADEIKANAALVAAAPDMLAALKTVILDERNAEIIARHCVGGESIVREMRAAIAKAEGR